MMSQYRTAPGNGGTPGSFRDVTTETLNLRFDHSLDLAPGWILALRSNLPLLAKNPLSSSDPDGDYLHGVGNIDFQAVAIRNLSKAWQSVSALALSRPPADAFGAGKWQILPVIGARYGIWEINSASYFEPVIR